MPYKLQESFLNTARKRRVKVTIYLVNGVRLQGRVRSFDLYTILIEDGRQQTLVYKHAITTIIPAEKLEIEFEEEGVPGAV
ncbi:MAG: RNA chaperone Hfq [Hydrogenobacter thermophilus]|jgi:host factor-I protein|uniref:RNA-binding protein Hfq n=2 Tax=Hydrogenobacter TaxID=939 RepID=D3DGK3_HYDTT|nr:MULTISPECIES: RNA chaperone Hfq [Hydrogenobacter]MCS7284272.1 RNA chaperone Hfq [Hydrogenobacter thermophilus]GBC88354.1 RNA-binding protein Hfq [bacterium HR13]ADO44890.1 RNA chaperone Hfq [Hydrogenobacter thermophilus TK-6]SNZ13958.1 RNA-binding protein Hfq [Hydrogenobacter hydrogenophilus]BAI68955.1 host facter [Hydrogenobacter thermophilus TK-6]